MRISDWSSDVCSSDLPLRLRHREAVRLLVAGIVADGVRPDDIAGIRQRVSALVAPDDIEDVVALVVNELHQLHEGNIKSEEHTSELQSLMRISYAVFCLIKKIE